MRIQDIFRIFQEIFYLALIGLAIVGIFLGIGYFFIYKKLLRGNRSLNKKKMLVWTLFIGYMFMVVGVTFVGRGPRQYGDSNLHFFSTYRQAWNSFNSVSWRQLILNILMLVPFGILLPLINKSFYKFRWTFGSALLLTITIEVMQLLTGYGVFDLDDIFNNMLGAIIGYGIVMAIITFINKGKNKYKKILIYLMPIIIVIGFSAGTIGFYNRKEFGNIYPSYSYKINMKNIELNLNTEIDEVEEVFLDLNKDKKYNIKKVPIYKSKVYNMSTGEEFFKGFLKNKNIEDDIEIDIYDDMSIYRSNGQPGYHMWFYFKGGTYDYTDFSSFDEGIEKIDVDEETVLKELNHFNIDIPELAVLEMPNDDNMTGLYKWNIEKHIDGDYITNGSLSCEYYNDDTIKKINNNIVKYKKIKDMEIKSKKEIYREIKQGKFNRYKSENIKTIDIEEMKLDYLLDTKGYYQPIYTIDVKINGEKEEILMPAI